MSKLYDVKKMYGQDFGIAVTNAPAGIVSSSNSLLKNMLLISAPKSSSKDLDGDGIVTLFVTDYEGNPVQLTYPISNNAPMLRLNDNGELQLFIDNKSLMYNADKSLQVNTKYLSLPTGTDGGIVKINDNIDIERDNSISQIIDTRLSGISINNEGFLYINDDFIKSIKKFVESSIIEKIRPLIKSNSEISFKFNGITIYSGDNTQRIEAITSDSNYDSEYDGCKIISNCSLSFTCKDNTPLTIYLESNNQCIIETNGTTTTYEKNDSFSIDDEIVYTHKLSGIKLIFLPNYYFIDTVGQERSIPLSISVQDHDDLYFNMNINQQALTGEFYFYSLGNLCITYKAKYDDNGIATIYCDSIDSMRFDSKGLKNVGGRIKYTLSIYAGNYEIYNSGDSLYTDHNLDTNSILGITSYQNDRENNEGYNIEQLNSFVQQSVGFSGTQIVQLSGAPLTCKYVLTINENGSTNYKYSNTCSIIHNTDATLELITPKVKFTTILIGNRTIQVNQDSINIPNHPTIDDIAPKICDSLISTDTGELDIRINLQSNDSSTDLRDIEYISDGSFENSETNNCIIFESSNMVDFHPTLILQFSRKYKSSITYNLSNISNKIFDYLNNKELIKIYTDSDCTDEWNGQITSSSITELYFKCIINHVKISKVNSSGEILTFNRTLFPDNYLGGGSIFKLPLKEASQNLSLYLNLDFNRKFTTDFERTYSVPAKYQESNNEEENPGT